MTVNVKKMTVNVTFFLTLSMTEKDHCKRYDEVEYVRKRLPSNSKHCKVYSALNSFLVILMVAVTFTVVIFGQI